MEVKHVMAKDLVCNMDVDEKTAKWKTVYKGKTYYFCAPGCKKAFEEEPETYINGGNTESGHSHEHGHCGCGCGGH
jgi:YHS domain-containing protein